MGFWTSFAKQLLLKALTNTIGGGGTTTREEDAREGNRRAQTGRCVECGRVVSAPSLQNGRCVLCRAEKGKKSDQRSQSDRGQSSAGAENDLTRAYETLGCKQSDSDSEIKKKYRALIKDCHVDSLPKDLPDYLVKAANKRFVEVQEAYELVMKLRTGGR